MTRWCLLVGLDILAVWVDDCGRDGVGLLISLLPGNLPVGFVFFNYSSV